ncbi:MAG: hypothetical protein Q7R43_02620, partial [Candidatus Daviesbacteria bacterium]|nr:hypothetical protein [Candidatus Daviesbacteria bacterium]
SPSYMVPKFISGMRGMFNSHPNILPEIALMLSFPGAKHRGVTHGCQDANLDPKKWIMLGQQGLGNLV